MVTLERDRLVFRFPELDDDAVLQVEFQRTLRIPDDDGSYRLPPGLGAFPLAHVDDYAERVPEGWREHGGVFLPMYQAEALWISFDAQGQYPFAVKVAAGKINAVTGQAWAERLCGSPQDYMVVPGQPWLDGFCVGKGTIRQFVAMPLGEGYTAEEQLTGVAEHGGLQIIVYPMKSELFARLREEQLRASALLEHVRGACAQMEGRLRGAHHELAARLTHLREELTRQRDALHSIMAQLEEFERERAGQRLPSLDPDLPRLLQAKHRAAARLVRQQQDALKMLERQLQLLGDTHHLPSVFMRMRSVADYYARPAVQACRFDDEMGLAPGGRMRQEIYEDRFGAEAWDESAYSRCFIHILNSLQYAAVTGNAPPTKPVSAADYTKAGLPWFEYYDADQKALDGAAKLAGLKSVAAKKQECGEPLSGNESVEPKVVKQLGPHADVVREGEF